MRGQFLEHIKSWHIDAILGWQSHHWSVGGFLWLLPEVAPPDRWIPFKENLLWTSISFVYYRVSCGGQTIQMCHSFRGKDWTRESEWREKSRTNQFVKAVCHCHVNVDCVSEQPGDNVLGSQAWRISRTYQIVAHWCNSWVPVASLIDRRIRACVPVCLRIWHALVLQCSRISCVANF